MSTQQNLEIVAAPAGGSLASHRAAMVAGRASAATTLVAALAKAETPAGRHVFVRRFEAQALVAARAVDSLHAAGASLARLAGAPVSVKDLYDVAGFQTTAASKSMRDVAPAAEDCLAVARVRAAGAVLVGHTTMSEFAFSGVGINPHFGTPVNAAAAALDPEPRIPGGSTSGGAVSVSIGAAFAALGSDTGGSIRIPAALQGLVGFKNTKRLTPLQGTVPLSTTLDTVCAITGDVRDAITMHEVLASRQVTLAGRALRHCRLAVPQTVFLDAVEHPVARAFDRAIGCLSRAGAQIEDLRLPAMNDVGALMAQGGFAAAESWAWHRRRLAERGGDYDPRVALRIRRGEAISAADYIEMHAARTQWISRMCAAMRGFDAMLSPTVPLVAPPIAPLVASDEQFFAVNALLLRNTSAVNLLDGCAISLPCHVPGEMPVGLMIWREAMADDTALDIALSIESALADVPDDRVR